MDVLAGLAGLRAVPRALYDVTLLPPKEWERKRGRRWPIAGAIAVLAASFAWQAYRLHGWTGLIDRALGRGLLLALLLFLVIRARPVILLIAANAAAVFGLFYVIGVSSWIVDGAIVLIGIIAAIYVARRRGPPSPAQIEDRRSSGDLEWSTLRALTLELWTMTRRPLKVMAAFWMPIWLLVGAADYVRDRGPLRLERNPERPKPVAAEFTNPVRVGLALSGGGYRAALMHAGVLSLMDSAGIPVQTMSTVSGGSIIGAFYAIGGEPREFLRAAEERRLNLARKMFRPFTLLRLLGTMRWGTSDYYLLPLPDYTRTMAQAELLDGLFFRQARHEHGSEVAPHQTTTEIELILCMTDIVGSMMIGVTPHGVIEQSVNPPTTRFKFNSHDEAFRGGHFHRDEDKVFPGPSALSMLVAASGAFPGAFKPLRVDVVRGLHDATRVDTTRYVLADGGMADNLGLVLMYAARQHYLQNRALIDRLPPGAREAAERWDVNLVIASDGSAISAPRIPRSGIQEVTSAIDVVSRASAGEYLAGNLQNPITTLLSPDPFVNLSSVGELAQFEFSHAGGSDTTALRSAVPGIYQAPSYMTLEPADLRFLVQTLDAPDSIRKELLTAVQFIADTNGAENGTNSKARSSRESWADDMVFRAIRSDFSKSLATFVATSTLASQFSPSQARALYRLGQYLFLLNKPYIFQAASTIRIGQPTPAGVLQAGSPTPVTPSTTWDSLRVQAYLHRTPVIMRP